MNITLVDYADPYKYKEADTEFVVFVKDGKRNNPLYSELSQVYKDNPLFRKMSMVAPVLSLPSSFLYGWKMVANNIASPKSTPSSIQPYAIQMGPIEGAVIRRAALDRIDYKFTGDIFTDSINLSLALWDSGQMVYIAPMTRTKGRPGLDVSHLAQVTPETQKLFKREMIG